MLKKGQNHTEETKTKISEANKGTTRSDETKKIMSDTRKGKKKNRRIRSPSQAIEVTDIKNNTTTCYNSIHETARALNILQASISMYFKNKKQKPYKGQYIFKKTSN